jgi:hydrogenase maturation protease
MINKKLKMPLIIGVGNIYRGDDAVGIIVARRLKDQLDELVTIIELSGEGTALMEAWQGSDHVVIIDAVSSGAVPGTIHHLDAHLQHIPQAFFHYSTHAFSIAEAIELSRVLKTLPPLVTIYGIEGKNFHQSCGLSPETEKAIDKVVIAVCTSIT